MCDNDDYKDNRCPICLDDIGDKNIATTECGHTFHLSCMLQNLRTSSKCPLCRNVVDEHINAYQQLWDFSDEDVEELSTTLALHSGRNRETAQNIVDFVNAEHPTPESVSEPQVNSVQQVVGDYVNEIVFDFMYLFRDWARDQTTDNIHGGQNNIADNQIDTIMEDHNVEYINNNLEYINDLNFDDNGQINHLGLTLSEVERVLGLNNT